MSVVEGGRGWAVQIRLGRVWWLGLAGGWEGWRHGMIERDGRDVRYGSTEAQDGVIEQVDGQNAEDQN